MASLSQSLCQLRHPSHPYIQHTPGIPDSRPLQEGDIINVDVTAYLNGFHGDTNATFCVGECDRFNTFTRSKQQAAVACYQLLAFRQCLSLGCMRIQQAQQHPPVEWVAV